MTDPAKPQVRLDPLSGLKVLLAPERSKRPLDLNRVEPADGAEAGCPFCGGNEEKTPPEIFATPGRELDGDRAGWSTRVVPNKFPLIEDEGPDKGLSGPLDDRSAGRETGFFNVHEARGAHEVIVHTPAHKLSMAELTDVELHAALETWKMRFEANSDAMYTHLMVNEGASAGASRAHTHAQLLALRFVPAAVARERERFNAYHQRSQGGCLLCDLVEEEMHLKERVVAHDDDAVLIAPFASRLPYHLQVVPRRHSERFESDGETSHRMLRKAFDLLIDRLGGMPPLNLWIRTAPQGADQFHWHIEILPRITELAGVELGVDVAVNTVSPESVASS